MACERGLISEMEYKQVYPLIYDNATKVSEYLSRKQKEFDETFDEEFRKFCFRNGDRLRYINDWRGLNPLAKSNFEGFKLMVAHLPETKSITEMIRESSRNRDNERRDWTLNDYRKNDLRR